MSPVTLSMLCPPGEDAYRLGLLVQAVDDAGSSGLSLRELRVLTLLSRHELVRLLDVCLTCGHVATLGERYVPRPRRLL